MGFDSAGDSLHRVPLCEHPASHPFAQNAKGWGTPCGGGCQRDRELGLGPRVPVVFFPLLRAAGAAVHQIALEINETVRGPGR